MSFCVGDLTASIQEFPFTEEMHHSYDMYSVVILRTVEISKDPKVILVLKIRVDHNHSSDKLQRRLGSATAVEYPQSKVPALEGDICRFA